MDLYIEVALVLVTFATMCGLVACFAVIDSPKPRTFRGYGRKSR